VLVHTLHPPSTLMTRHVMPPAVTAPPPLYHYLPQRDPPFDAWAFSTKIFEFVRAVSHPTGWNLAESISFRKRLTGTFPSVRRPGRVAGLVQLVPGGWRHKRRSMDTNVGALSASPLAAEWNHLEDF
jgi:hypothetical protein